MPQVWFALHPPYPTIWTAHKALAPPLLYALRQLPFNKTFPLVCFALLTFFSLFFLRLKHAVGRASAAKAEIIACAHPTNFPPPSTTSNKPNCRNETLWIHEQRDRRKGKDGRRSKKKCSCQKKPKRRVWGGTLNLGKPSHCEKKTKKHSGRVITAGIQWAIKDDAVLSGGSPKGMCVYLCPWRETRLNEREWLLCECLRKSGHVHTNRLIPGSEQH